MGLAGSVFDLKYHHTGKQMPFQNKLFVEADVYPQKALA